MPCICNCLLVHASPYRPASVLWNTNQSGPTRRFFGHSLFIASSLSSWSLWWSSCWSFSLKSAGLSSKCTSFNCGPTDASRPDIHKSALSSISVFHDFCFIESWISEGAISRTLFFISNDSKDRIKSLSFFLHRDGRWTNSAVEADYCHYYRCTWSRNQLQLMDMNTIEKHDLITILRWAKKEETIALERRLQHVVSIKLLRNMFAYMLASVFSVNDVGRGA